MLYEFNGGLNRMPPRCSRHPLHSQPCHFCEEENRKNRESLLEYLKSIQPENKEEINEQAQNGTDDNQNGTS